jgi:hypothetical protein
MIEKQAKTQIVPNEELSQIHDEIYDLKTLILGMQKSIDQLVRKIDRV